MDFSAEFEKTLHRALAIANERRHELSTLEHLLLALLDDADASAALIACKGNIDELRHAIVAHLENEYESVAPNEEAKDSTPTASFQRVIQRAVIHVQSSGRQTVNGSNALVALFAERESFAAHFLQERNITRYDIVDYITRHTQSRAKPNKRSTVAIEQSIAKSAESAPQFRPYRGAIRFRQASGNGRLSERKSAARERCEELQRRCTRRANEQPELKQLADKYATALAKLRKDRGAYGLFLIGMEIEALLRAKTAAPADSERNIPIDGDLLFAVHSLIVAHAGLITLFPDVTQTTKELDQYRKLSNSLDSFREDVLDPVFEKLDAAQGIFDDETRSLTHEVRILDDVEKKSGQPPSQGTTAIKHSWLRGALASMGQYLLRQLKGSAEAARDATIENEVATLLKDRAPLTRSIIKFLSEAKDSLWAMAESLPSAFGWLTALLSWLKFF